MGEARVWGYLGTVFDRDPLLCLNLRLAKLDFYIDSPMYAELTADILQFRSNLLKLMPHFAISGAPYVGFYNPLQEGECQPSITIKISPPSSYIMSRTSYKIQFSSEHIDVPSRSYFAGFFFCSIFTTKEPSQ